MMDWTDTHCRTFHRMLSRHALLYTEMVTAPALVLGGASHLLRFDASQHPVALQLGGSDPGQLAQAARMGAEAGYDEINLNVGCPSDRVQSGEIGAILMTRPERVAECVSEMCAAQGREVTVKCRIGVDEQVPERVLPDFISRVSQAGARRVIVHARKAWLKGLSPKENRDVPPLDHALVHRMAVAFPEVHLSINGGIGSLDDVEAHLEHMDGVMVGRAAYHTPADILLDADARIFGDPSSRPDRAEIVRLMMPYIEAHLSTGGKLSQVTRHMLGLFAGMPGARRWRRILSEGAHRPGAGCELLEDALGAVLDRAA